MQEKRENPILAKLKKEADKSIEKTKKRIGKELGKKRVSLSVYAVSAIKEELGEILEVDPASLNIELPPAHIKEDLSVALFDLAKSRQKDPKTLGQELAGKINLAVSGRASNFIESAQAFGPYLNLILRNRKSYDRILKDAAKLKDKFGKSDINAGKVAAIDYSGPNIAKPFGVGHLRSTIIGQALVNIYEATGYAVVKDNHLGDWGTQFGKLIYAYQNWVDKKKFKEDPIGELNDLYVKFHREAAEKPEIEDEARKIFQRLEEGDEKLLKLWDKFKKISIAEFKKVYDSLGVKFDTYLGESYFSEESARIIEEALEKKIAFKDQATGAVAVEMPGLPSFLLRKQDGSTLYIARDLATLKFRTLTFNPQKTLYVVGEEQSLHFKQLFALAKAFGYADGNEAKHVGFGLVLAGGEKMSTRKGTLVLLEDLIGQSIGKAREILIKKNRDLPEEEIGEISEIVGIGAVIYNDLRQSRQKNISFDWNKMLDFEGGSAAYLQYTYARINSILKKTAGKEGIKPAKYIFEDKSEFTLTKKIMFFPQIILNAQKQDSPHLIATYLEELAQLFNNFYNKISIMGTEDGNLKLSRLSLIAAVAAVIKNGLSLLNIKTAERI